MPKEYFVAGMEPGVEASIQAAIETLRGLGAEIGEVSLPHSDYGLAAYYIIAPAECSANLARYDGVKYGYSAPDAETMWDGYYKTRGRGFGAEVKRRIMLGTYALQLGLLRRLLRQGPEDPHADQAGFRPRVRAVRRAPGADLADGRVRDRRQDG